MKNKSFRYDGLKQNRPLLLCPSQSTYLRRISLNNNDLQISQEFSGSIVFRSVSHLDQQKHLVFQPLGGFPRRNGARARKPVEKQLVLLGLN
jgi:hypothetical protein